VQQLPPRKAASLLLKRIFGLPGLSKDRYYWRRTLGSTWIFTSDRNGVATFLIASRGRASNSLEVAGGGRSQSGGVREKVTVPTLTLDTLLDYFSYSTFLKIDVEGAEAFVLKGAKRLLSEIRPTIYIEVGSEQVKEVTKILIESDYALLMVHCQFENKNEQHPVPLIL
jgi:hypothetical protein